MDSSTIEIRGYPPTTLGGRLVCFYSRSRVSHVTGVAAGMEYEAVPSFGKHGVVVHKPISAPEYTILLEVSKEQRNIFLRYLNSKLGKRYDWWGDLAFIFPGVKQSRKAFFCSELIYNALREAEIVPDIRELFNPWQVILLAEQRRFDMLSLRNEPSMSTDHERFSS